MKYIRTVRILLLLLLSCSVWVAVVQAQDYSLRINYGQTPYQLGYLSSGNTTGWSWWDLGSGMQQKNIISVSIMENTTPISGLSPPAWTRDSSVLYGGSYSWKAGYGIHSWHYLDNYSSSQDPFDDIDLMHMSHSTKKGIFTALYGWLNSVLTGVQPMADTPTTNLTFQTSYNITGVFGFVKVSTDRGATWDTLRQYSGDCGGWVTEEIKLTKYEGEKILIAFHCVSNGNGNANANAGWWIDDITVQKGGTVIFSDDAEKHPPVLKVNVTYPHYDHVSSIFTNSTTTIDLAQDYVHLFYYGIFNFPDDAYAGRYHVEFNTTIQSEDLSASTSFNTTLWGCQARGCHDSWSPQGDTSTRNPTVMIHPDNITSGLGGNCMSMCHSAFASQFLPATPIHLHDLIYGHNGGFIKGESKWTTIFDESNTTIQIYSDTSIGRPLSQTNFNETSHVTDANCTDCHTGFIHDQSGSTTYNIASPSSLTGTAYVNPSGVHKNVICEACHGIYYKTQGKGLEYPPFGSGIQITDTIGNYSPKFMSYEALVKTYIIDMDDSGSINITVKCEDNNDRIYLSLIGPIDDSNGLQDLNTNDRWDGTYCVPGVNGTAVFAYGSRIYYPSGEDLHGVIFESGPDEGIWIARVFSRSGGTINYTITSSHPIKSKPVIHLPYNCSECHNPDASGTLLGARTSKPMPAWDSNGFSYTHCDLNNDGKDDIGCRLCHNAFHDITIVDCITCHIQRPGGHNMAGYYDMAYTDCLSCHSDPHFEPEEAAGGDCTECHLEGGSNANPGLPIINKTGFFNSIHYNITGDFDSSNYTRISQVCWGCHNNYSQQLIDPFHTRRASELPKCEDCHDNATPLNSEHLIRTPLQVREHQPLGEDIDTNSSIANCTICHNKSLTTTPPVDDVKYREAKNYVSHYGRNRTDMQENENGRIVTNCSYCHLDGGREFNDVFTDPLYTANVTHGTDCTGCHGSARIHDEDLTLPTMSDENDACLACHDRLINKHISAAEYKNSAHKDINCIDCHTPRRQINSKLIDRESRTYNFTLPANITSLNATLNREGDGILNLILYAPDTTYSGTSINISLPRAGNWSAVVWDVSGDSQFILMINVTMRHPGSTPKYCDECHINEFGQAPLVYKHITDMSTVPTTATCELCHSNGAYPAKTAVISAAHYAPIEALNTSDCIKCHTGIADGWGDPPDQRNHTHYAFINETLRAGEPFRLIDNYSLVLIETTQTDAVFDIEQNGILLKRDYISEGGRLTYEISGIEDDTTTLIDLIVTKTFLSKGTFVAEVCGNVLSSRIHIETENEQCYACHDREYRSNIPDGMDYVVLQREDNNVTLGRIAVNFAQQDKKMLTSEEIWDLGENFSLQVVDVSVQQNNAHFRLYRNWTLIEDSVISQGSYFTHEQEMLDRDIEIFSAKLDGVFTGMSTLCVTLSDVLLIAGEHKIIDENITILQTNIQPKYLPLDSIITVGEVPETFHVGTITPGVYSADCISCHAGDGVAPIKIDINKFKGGVHAGLNGNATYSSFITDKANKACWACHGNGSSDEPVEHPTAYLDDDPAHSCVSCHAYSKFDAAQIYTHYSGAGISTDAECWDCHSLTLTNDTLKNVKAATSHYSTRDDLLDTSQCAVCHNNETNGLLWGDAPQITKHNADNDCTLCHAGGGVNMFHDTGITITRQCEDCHVDKLSAEKFNLTPIITHYPGAPEDKVNTLKNYEYTCSVCHNTTNKSLHTGLIVREYANETFGYCFPCHSVEGQFPHKPQSQIDVLRHGSGVKVVSGCEECHDPESVSRSHTPFLVDKGYFSGAVRHDVECTECHPPHEERKYQPYEGILCTDCHTEYGSMHYAGAEIKTANKTSTCLICHNEEADKYHELTRIVGNITDETFEGCRECHKDIESLKVEYNSSIQLKGGMRTSISHPLLNQTIITCTSCHNATGESRFHFDSYPLGTVQNTGWQDWNTGNITGCKDCHTYHGGAPPFNATNMGVEGLSPSGTAHGFAPNCTLCHGGGDPISLHTLATSEFIPRIAVSLTPDRVISGEVSLLECTVVLPPLTKVTMGEYFINDMGKDSTGEPLQFIVGGSNDSSVLLGAVIDTSDMPAGQYIILVHVKDSSGKWSKNAIDLLTVNKSGGMAFIEFILKVVLPLIIIIGSLILIWRRIK